VSLIDIVDLIQQFGPFFVAVLFFLWRDWKREDRLSKRIDHLEDEQRQVRTTNARDGIRNKTTRRIRCHLTHQRLRRSPLCHSGPHSSWPPSPQ
jgi:hypothetical protein